MYKMLFCGVGCFFFIPTRHQFSNNSFNDNNFFQLNTLQDTTSPHIFFSKIVQSVKFTLCPFTEVRR